MRLSLRKTAKEVQKEEKDQDGIIIWSAVKIFRPPLHPKYYLLII